MSVLADTHVIHWFFTDPGRLSRKALDCLHDAERDEQAGIVVSVASRMDLHYLVAVGRLNAVVGRQLWAVLNYPHVNVRSAPITDSIAERSGDPRLGNLRDPWDRLIVATAVDLGIPLVTADDDLAALGRHGVLEVIW